MDSFQILIFVLVGFFGLAVGSFLNVVILRFNKIESIVRTRSHCPHCQKILPWYDLVPFFSYIILAGRCRECRKNISIQYPLVEVFTALIFILIHLFYGLTLESVFLVIISSLLIVIAVYDWRHFEIPDILIYIAAIFTLGFISYSLILTEMLGDLPSWLDYIYGLGIGLVFFGFLVVVSRQKWMGWGDVLLGSLMGLIVGYPNVILALFLAFLLGSIFSIILMIFRKKTLKDAVPFGPFLVLATFITLFWGQSLMNIYLLRIGIF